MRTATYKSVLDKISGYLGEDGGMSAEDAGIANRLINSRLRGAWEYYWWPELMGPLTLCQFRPSYDPTVTYAAPTATVAQEVFYPVAQAYYQALQPTLNQPPATGSDNTENSAYWALSRPVYSGPWWAAGVAQVVGDIVQNPADNRFYQCFSAHTTVGAALDATKYGILTPFVRSLGYTLADGTQIGEVKKLWDRNPDVEFNAREVPFVLRPSFVLVRGILPLVYAEYRTQPSSYTGLKYDPAATYNPGDQAYYDTTGDYYVNLGSCSGVVPTAANNWARRPVPYIFAEYLAQSVYAAMVAREEEVPEDFSIEQSAGYAFILAELQKIERQQGQTRQMNVINTRP